MPAARTVGGPIPARTVVSTGTEHVKPVKPAVPASPVKTVTPVKSVKPPKNVEALGFVESFTLVLICPKLIRTDTRPVIGRIGKSSHCSS